MEPLVVEAVESTFFGDRQRFGSGTTEIDSAFLMGGIPVTWKRRRQLVGADPGITTMGSPCG